MSLPGEEPLYERIERSYKLSLVDEALDVQLKNGGVGSLLGDKGAHDQDRNVPSSGVTPDLRDDMEAGYLRHDQVEQNEIRVIVVDEAQRLLAIRRLQNLMTGGGEQLFRYTEYYFLVIDHENLLPELGVRATPGAGCDLDFILERVDLDSVVGMALRAADGHRDSTMDASSDRATPEETSLTKSKIMLLQSGSNKATGEPIEHLQLRPEGRPRSAGSRPYGDLLDGCGSRCRRGGPDDDSLREG